MIEKYLQFVFRFAWAILIGLAALTYYFFNAMAGLTEDNNPYFLPEDHPVRSVIYDMRRDFTGTYDSILVAVHHKDSVFNKTTLNAMFELTEQSKAINFVDDSDIERLKAVRDAYPENQSLKTGLDQILQDGLSQADGQPLRQLWQQGTDLEAADRKSLRVIAERADPVREMAGMAATENVFTDASGTLYAQKTLNQYDADPEVIRKAIMNNELMEGGFIDKEGKVALLVVELSLLEDDAYGQIRAYEAFQKLVADYQKAHPEFTDQVYIGGVPVFFAAQKQVIDHDFATLLPLVLLIIAVVLAVFFRTILGVFLPMLNVVLCTIWTLGMMAILEMPLDVITAILPVFLITICSSDAIHVMAEYYHQRKLVGARVEAMRRAMLLMFSPVILTTVTTCATFTVSTATAIESLQNFGILISFGMFAALVISLLLLPAAIALFKGKTGRVTVATSAKDDLQVARTYLVSRVLTAMLKPVTRHRTAFNWIFIVMMASFAYLASHVRIDDMGSGYFAKTSDFRISDDFINQHIAGTSPGWIEIDSGAENKAMSLEMLTFVDSLENFIHQQENVTFSYSAARYVRRINYTMNDFDEQYNRLPLAVEKFTETDPQTGETFVTEVSGEDIVRQAVLMYENGGGTDITNVYSTDFRKTMLLYTLGTTVASDYNLFLDKLKPWLAANTPEGYTVKLAGTPVIWSTVLDALITSQTLSLFMAFATVLLVMALWLRSFRLGLAGTLPLLATVVVYFALMGTFNIELNIGTAITSFLVLGIVDYSVHFIVRIKTEMQRGLDIPQAVEMAILISGRAILANILVFTVGFVALLFSDFKPLVDLGMLVGLSLFVSGMMSLFVVTLYAPWFFANVKAEQDVEALPQVQVTP